jgi:hypothetical protein
VARRALVELDCSNIKLCPHLLQAINSDHVEYFTIVAFPLITKPRGCWEDISRSGKEKDAMIHVRNAPLSETVANTDIF